MTFKQIWEESLASLSAHVCIIQCSARHMHMHFTSALKCVQYECIVDVDMHTSIHIIQFHAFLETVLIQSHRVTRWRSDADLV